MLMQRTRRHWSLELSEIDGGFVREDGNKTIDEAGHGRWRSLAWLLIV